MIKLFIDSIGKAFEVENGIYQIIIKDPVIYRKIALDIDSEIILSVDDKTFDLMKESIIIYDPINIDINDTKIIKSLYKLIEKRLHESFNKELFRLEELLFNLSEELVLSSNFEIDYDPQIDISKLLSSLGIKYKISSHYYTNLLQYLKINIELFSKKLFIIFGLSSLLNSKEMEMLNYELILLNASVVNISYSSISHENIELILDEDWCIL